MKIYEGSETFKRNSTDLKKETKIF